MQNQKQNSNLPLLIIGAVFIVVAIGGWWFYTSSKATTTAPKTNTNTNPNKAAEDAAKAKALYDSAPPGAQPPNMLGASTLPVTVEEFADFQCPTCAAVHTKMKEINSLYSGRIKFIYRSYPLVQIHKNAYTAASAAEAAGVQGKFWDMQNQLFTNQSEWSNLNDTEVRKKFEEYAQKIGLEIPKFQTDMLSMQTKKRIDDDLARGTALKINGTPSVYINGQLLPFEKLDVGQMRQIIDAELAKAGTQPNQSAPTTAPAQPAANSNTNSANK